MRVLAIQLKRIGDLILTLPALSALKASGAHVTLAMAPGGADLLPAFADCVDEALIYGRDRTWTRVLRGKVDACIDFTGRERSALLTLASRAGSRIISRDALRGKARWRAWCYNVIADTSVRERHTADYYLDHLRPLGLKKNDSPAPALRVPPGSHGMAAGSYVVFHPGTARTEKYWRSQRWAEVMDVCQRDLALPCVLTGGRGDAFEDQRLDEIRARLERPCVDLAGKLDLLAFASLLAGARLVVTVDSGPMHLAAALGVPQVALFGPTNPFHWRPRGSRCLILQPGHDAPLAEQDFQPHSPGAPMEGISTAAVIRCIKELASPDNAPRTAG